MYGAVPETVANLPRNLLYLRLTRTKVRVRTMTLNSLRSILCAAVLPLFFASSLAAQADTWRVIGSVNWLERTGEAERDDELPPVGTARLESDFESGGGAGIGLAYFLTDNIALEARASVIRSDLKVGIRTATDAVAVIDLGGFNLYPLALVAQYHIPTSDRLRFFLGAGAGYLIVSDVETAGTPIGERIEFEETVELIVNGGFNWSFGDRWALNADARYVPIESEASAVFVGADQVEDINVKPLILSAGLSYRF